MSHDSIKDTAWSGFANNGIGNKNAFFLKGDEVGATGAQIDNAIAQLPSATKTVTISVEGDLPPSVVTAKGVRHPMADDTDYFFVNDLDTGIDGFFLGNNTIMRGTDSSIVMLTYTGTAAMFASVASSNKITKIRPNCPNAALFDYDGATDYVFQLVNCSITECESIGAINDFLACQISDVSFEQNTLGGIDFSGTNGVFISMNNLIVQDAGTIFDFGTATFAGISLQNNFYTPSAGVTFIDGAAASANLTAGNTGTVSNNKNLSGLGTALSGISSNDARWEFSLNDDIADTRPDGLLSMQGNATETAIATQSVPVKVAGTWVNDSVSQFEATADGRLTYKGVKDARLPITISLSVEPVSGGSTSMSVLVAVNGTVVTNSSRNGATNAGNPTSITVPWQHTFSTDDFVEIFVQNNDGTVNILASSGLFRVN